MGPFRNLFRAVRSLKYLYFILALTTAVVGCATLAPIAMEIAKNLLVTAAYNHKPEYADGVGKLFLALAEQKTPATAETALYNLTTINE